ncbi:MAG: hypothetical protein JNL10_12005 [Verrucomicrobiales bacterium]|nr:hypothetical protein [Verrucomicrobiales bacterium]
MDERQAAEQLQTIRLLMERAALYRRALGPTLVGIGILGMAAGSAGAAGWGGRGARDCVLYWTGVAVLAVAWAGFRVRRQALGAAEPFWTPPTRRVLSAMTPPIAVAVVGTALRLLEGAPPRAETLSGAWMILYGLGLHAAGHFTLRGIRLLGWAFIAAGLISLGVGPWVGGPGIREAHLAMALTFGLGHLAAGAWLLLVERKRDQ